MRKFDGWTRRISAVRSLIAAAIVCRPRLVRRPDLAQDRARLRHHVGHAEAAADLDQLAARHDDLASRRQRRQHEHRRRRVVVDDDRRFGAGQAAEQRLGVDVAPAARAAAQVVLERRVAARDLGDAIDGRRRERRAAEIGVDDDAGRVDDRLQRRPERVAELCRGGGFDPRDDRGFGRQRRVAAGNGDCARRPPPRAARRRSRRRRIAPRARAPPAAGAAARSTESS